MSRGVLYLIPAALAAGAAARHLTPAVREALLATRHYVAEHAREARRFISALQLGLDIGTLHFAELNKHSPPGTLTELLQPALAGQPLGLLSDAGSPAVADPGAELVHLAHQKGVQVIPLPGPSAILLALMASGLGGQQFRFSGYLPVDKKALVHTIRQMEKGSATRQETQIFIETPYRNDKLLHTLLNTLQPGTLLCLATDLTGASEQIITLPVARWQQNPFRPGKKPTVFLFRAGS